MKGKPPAGAGTGRLTVQEIERAKNRTATEWLTERENRAGDAYLVSLRPLSSFVSSSIGAENYRGLFTRLLLAELTDFDPVPPIFPARATQPSNSLGRPRLLPTNTC